MTAKERLSYRRKVAGFIWQQTSRNLLPYMTAGQNVLLPMRLSALGRGEQRRRAGILLDTLDIAHCANRTPDRMSGGEQQRAAIATALANQPKVLLADEPTGELDSATARDVFAALQTANTELGATVLVVTHDPAVSSQVRPDDRDEGRQDEQRDDTARRPPTNGARPQCTHASTRRWTAPAGSAPARDDERLGMRKRVELQEGPRPHRRLARPPPIRNRSSRRTTPASTGSSLSTPRRRWAPHRRRRSPRSPYRRRRGPATCGRSRSAAGKGRGMPCLGPPVGTGSGARTTIRSDERSFDLPNGPWCCDGTKVHARRGRRHPVAACSTLASRALRLRVMRGAGPSAMLELTARVPAVRGAGRERKSGGAVMAGVNDSDARTVVAVLGAGIMGSAMARNLAAAGLDTRVWDRSPRRGRCPGRRGRGRRGIGAGRGAGRRTW